MKIFSDNELETLLDELESDLTERKQSFKGDTPKKARQAVCAFANDLPNHNQPGVLFNGFIQAFGRGIATAQKEMKKNGNPKIEFLVNQSAVLCTLRKKA